MMRKSGMVLHELQYKTLAIIWKMKQEPFFSLLAILKFFPAFAESKVIPVT